VIKSRTRSVAAFACLAILSAAVIAQDSGGGGAEKPSTPPAGSPRGPGGPGGPGERGPGERGPGERGPGERGGVRGEVPVGFVMKGMGRSMKQLMGQVTDASKRAENLKLVNDLQRGCVMAKGQPLSKELLVTAKDDAEKAKRTETYRKALHEGLKTLLEVEELVADGKGDAAKARLEAFIKIRDAAHKELGVSED